jgi:serine/threonine protein kinase
MLRNRFPTASQQILFKDTRTCPEPQANRHDVVAAGQGGNYDEGVLSNDTVKGARTLRAARNAQGEAGIMDPGTKTSVTASAPVGPLPATPDWSGKRVGDFHLLRRLGQGGMGQVYLAEQISLKRKVAIKTMRTDLAVTAVSLQRFKSEAEAIARVNHANIVQVYAIGEEAGLHYMALEYVQGCNLREFLTKKGPPELHLALRIMRQVAAALQRASELGIIHRDIKPENILLTKRGEIKVADFGLSRCFAGESSNLNLTQSGITLGTPLYMSPEQVQGKPLDPRTDIYSFGVTCYHLFAGQPPFVGQTPFEVALQHVQAEPVPLAQVRPDLPPEICAIIHKMMAKDLDKRYQTCADLLKELNQFRETLAALKTQQQRAILAPATLASREAETMPLQLESRRIWWVSLAAASIVLALLTGGTAAWLSRRAPLPQPASPPAPSSIPEGTLVTERQKNEQFLREAVEKYANPGNDPARRDLGLRVSLELGLFYLKDDRLEEANQFFASLTDHPTKVRAYRTLGRLGHAIVLARQDKAAESNQLFLELLPSRGKPGAEQIRFFLNQPQLRYEMAHALEYNKANLRKPLPPELERLREPPHPQPSPGKR